MQLALLDLLLDTLLFVQELLIVEHGGFLLLRAKFDCGSQEAGSAEIHEVWRLADVDLAEFYPLAQITRS